MIFYKLKNQLSQQMQKKASWEDVAKHYDIPHFKNKDSRQISMLVSQWSKRGIPTKVHLWLIHNNFAY